MDTNPREVTTRLFRLLQESFNESELRDLCFRLDVDYEELAGRSRSDKTRELIFYVDRRGRLEDLILVCREARPHLDWGVGIPSTDSQAIPVKRNRIQQLEQIILKESYDQTTARQVLLRISEVSRSEDEHYETLTRFNKALSRVRKESNEGSTIFKRLFPRQKTNDSEEIVSALNYVAGLFRGEGQNRTALSYYETVLQLWQANNNRIEEARTFGNIGNIYRDIGNTKQAISFYEESINIYHAVGDSLAEANALQNLSSMLLADTDDIDTTLDILTRAEKLWAKLEDKPGLFAILNNKGTIYSRLNDIQAAQETFKRALLLAQETGNLQDEVVVLTNMALIATQIADWERAKELYNRALHIHENLRDFEGMTQVLGNLGGVYANLHQWDRAQNYYQQMQTVAQRQSDLSSEVIAWENIGKTHAAIGEVNKALDAYNKAYTLQRQLGDRAGLVRVQDIISRISRELEHGQQTLSLVSSDAQQFFQRAGFLLTTTGQINSFICLPDKHPWQKKIHGEVYTEIAHDRPVDDAYILSLRETALQHSRNATTVFVLVEHPVRDEAWLQIATLRLKNFYVIPIPLTLLYEGKTSTQLASERLLLAKHLERFLGKGRDPYDVRSPVSDVLNFFGREAIAQGFKNQLMEGHPIGIFGLRKIGKSSLMRYMQQCMPCPAAWIDLQAGVELSGLYSRILQSWHNDARARFDIDLGFEKIRLDPKDADPRFFQLTQEILNRLENEQQFEDTRLAIFLDEIELIMPPSEANGPELELYLSLMKTLRALVQEDGRVSLVVAGVDPFVNQISRWGKVQNPFFKLLQEEYLLPLRNDDCIQMVRNIGRQVELAYTDDALELITQASGCHPFLARQLCSLAFHLNDRQPGEISATLIKSAQEQFLFDPKYSTFLSDTGLWGEARNKALWGKDGALASQKILISLSKSETPLSMQSLLGSGDNKAALRTAFYGLKQLSLISSSKKSPNEYTITFGLLRSWIRQVYLGLHE